MDELFRYYLRVRYGECDAQKVVFNARYAEYIDLATTEFFRAIGFGAALLSGALDFQVVKQTIEWKMPARFDEVLELSVQAIRIGTTSFTLQTTFRLAGGLSLVASAETVYVLVDPRTLQKTPIAVDLRSAMEIGAPGIETDHAGYCQHANRQQSTGRE